MSSADGNIALFIVFAFLGLLGIGGYFLWQNRKFFGLASEKSWNVSSFTVPPERALYIAAKEKLKSLGSSEELKKMLMQRAMKTVPIVMSMHTDGPAIERLYKKGMLTDEMHYQVKEQKAFVEAEWTDVIQEADEIHPGWGQHIWQQAAQYHQLLRQHKEGKSNSSEDSDREIELEDDSANDGIQNSSVNSAEKKKDVGVDKKKDKKKTVLPGMEKMTPEEKANFMAEQLLKEEEELNQTKKQTQGAGKKNRAK